MTGNHEKVVGVGCEERRVREEIGGTKERSGEHPFEDYIRALCRRICSNSHSPPHLPSQILFTSAAGYRSVISLVLPFACRTEIRMRA